MSEPSPLVVSLDPGTHFICECGATSNPPYCNGNHLKVRGDSAKPE